MLKKLMLFLLFVFFCGINLSFGLDWKSLHEKADSMNLDDAQKACRDNPDSIEELYVLALAYLNLHKDKEAEEVFHRILALDPKISWAKWGLAEALRRKHQPQKSEDLINEVFKALPDFPPACITLAYINYNRLNFNQAVMLANKVLKQGEKKVDRNNYVRALLLYAGTKGTIAHYGGALSKLINGTAVLRNLKAADKLQPESAAVSFGLGSYYLLAPALAGGNLEKAKAHLKKAVAIDPHFPDAYVRLAQLYKIKGDNAAYSRYLNKALEIDPQNELAQDISSGRCKFICPYK
ncbi:MAG: TRAP transporter TatT component family protein [Candidatus Omnitrophota bacterium]